MTVFEKFHPQISQIYADFDSENNLRNLRNLRINL